MYYFLDAECDISRCYIFLIYAYIYIKFSQNSSETLKIWYIIELVISCVVPILTAWFQQKLYLYSHLISSDLQDDT